MGVFESNKPYISVFNDQHLFSGTTTHIFKIYENLMNHNIDSNLYQFLIDNRKAFLPKDAIVKKGLLFNLPSDTKVFYNFKLAVNFMSGYNWKSYKNIHSKISLLSGPTLLPLVKFHTNTIVVGHDLFFLKDDGSSKILGSYMRNMYNLFNKAKHIIVNSEYTREDFINKLKIDKYKISVVYPSFDSNIFHPGTSNARKRLNLGDNDVILLSVGGDNPNKNVETTIKLLSKLPDNYKLIRIGRNFYTTKLIETLNLKKRVILLGNIDTNSLAEMYRISNFFIFPSLFEGFGIPVVEAMASGLPVIVSNRTSLPEVVGDAGIICEPTDINSMSDSIIKLTDDTKYQKIRERSLIRSRHFSTENQFISLQNVLSQFK